MVKNRILILALLLITVNSFAQNRQSTSVVNQLKIEIVDVVEKKPLVDLDLILANENDTNRVHIDSVNNLSFDLNFSGNFSLTAIKEGYDTLTLTWNNPPDLAELLVEFFMPKITLTKEQKRKAHANSLHLSEIPCDNCGGFERFRVGYNEMCVIRLREFKNKEHSGGAYEVRKLRYY